MKKYKIRRRRKTFKTKYIFIALIIGLMLISTAYARYSTELRINGTAHGEQEQYDVTYLFFSNPTSYPSTIGYMSTYSYTFAGTPVIENVIMGERTLTRNTDYTYTNGTLTIPDVTGNLVIQSESSGNQLIVTFDVDGSTTLVSVNSGDTVNKPSDPQKNKYEFRGWYDENDVEFDFSTPITQNITLYAKWEATEYQYNGAYVFDGTNYKDTGIMLFSEKNAERDFIVSFTIDAIATSQGTQPVLFGSMDESGNPYPGLVMRLATGNFNGKISLLANVKSGTSSTKSITFKQGIDIVIKRENGIISYSIDGGNTFTQLGDFSTFSKYFNATATFGAGLDKNLNPFRYFVGTLSNMSVVLESVKTYTIEYNANGGTGTVEDQTAYINKDIILSQNSFTKENKSFICWNTKADGSGTDYNAEQVVRNIANANETITLYAKWIDLTKYNVVFHSNYGTDTTKTQEHTYGIYQKLSKNTFTRENYDFMEWNTESDGSGTSYTDEQEVLNLATTNGDTVNLYAIWVKNFYEYQGNYAFDGTNYIDTGIKLYDEDNVTKDYEISFEIVNYNSSWNLDTIMNAMYESSPYPGILLRKTTNKGQYHLICSGASGGSKSYDATNTTKFKITRTNGKIYVSVNDGESEYLADHSNITTFDTPVTFGCSLLTNGTPQRYFTGTLANLKVVVYD